MTGFNLPPGCTNADIERQQLVCGVCVMEETISESKSVAVARLEDIDTDLERLIETLGTFEATEAVETAQAFAPTWKDVRTTLRFRIELIGKDWNPDDFSEDRCSEHAPKREDFYGED